MVDLSKSFIPGDHPDCRCYTVFQGYKHYPGGQGDGTPGAGKPPFNGGEYIIISDPGGLGGDSYIQYGEEINGYNPIIDAFYVLTSTWVQSPTGYARVADSDEVYQLPTLAEVLRPFNIEGIPYAVVSSHCDPCPAPPIPPDPNPIAPNPPDPLPPPFPDPFPKPMDCCPEVLDLLRVLVVRVNKVTEDINEINDCLDSPKFATDDADPGVKRVANLGYYIERIARVLGISVNSNGSVRSIRQKRIIERGDTIPTGWNFGQWGSNTGANAAGQTGGNANELRDGIVYEQRSNYKDLDPSNPNNIAIHQGNYTLCENIPQLLDEVLDDLDKALGWQDLGANVIPNADGSGKYCSFEGLSQLLVEVAYDLSRVSQFASQSQISSLITQAVTYELLKATGQPLAPKSFPVDVGGDQITSVPYTGLANDAPSQLEQTGWLMQNLAPILAAMIKLKEDTPTP